MFMCDILWMNMFSHPQKYYCPYTIPVIDVTHKIILKRFGPKKRKRKLVIFVEVFENGTNNQWDNLLDIVHHPNH
jgi:hypothetical protein